MKIVFMGTPDFAVPCLKALVENGHEIPAVFTQPDRPKGRGYKMIPPPVKKCAEEYSIPVFQPLSLRKGEDAEKSMTALREISPELIIVVAYGQILPKEVLELPKYGCINIHASLLPEYRGAAPIQRCILDGKTRTGVTSMMMEEGLDTGDMLIKKELEIGKNETASELHDRLSEMGAEVLLETVKAVENGRNLYRNIKYAIQFLLSGNFGAILAVLYASIAGLPVPFAPVHLLFINLLTDSLPAIALGVEPHTSDVMNEKPRPADESILTKDFLTKIGLEGLVIGVMTMISFLTGYHQDGALLGSTYAFGTLCLARLFHGYNCKSDHPVIFTKRFFNNKWMQGAFALGAILITAVLTIPGLHQVFKVETLNFEQLGTVYLYAFACFPIIQLLKWVRGKLSE